jgi:hypothetical protein
VQQRLRENAARGRGTSSRSIASALAEKLFDAGAQPLYVQGANKATRRYRHYVSRCRKVDPALLEAVARSRVWFEELACVRTRSLADIARHENLARRYVERLSRPAFAAPKILEAICQGRQPAEVNAETLLNRIDLPLEWWAQLTAIGPA